MKQFVDPDGNLAVLILANIPQRLRDGGIG